MKKFLLSFVTVIILLGTALITLTGCETDTKRERESKEKSTNSNISENTESTENITNNTNTTKNTSTNTTNSSSNTSSTEDTSKSFEEKKVDKLSPVTWTYTPIDFSNLRWLNTENYGNICIPSDWIKDTDAESLSPSTVVFESEDISNVIIIDDCEAALASMEVQTLLYKLSVDPQLTEWSYETIKLDNRNAVVINAKFVGINHIQTNMFIATEDQKRMVCVSLESPDPNIVKLVKTFTFKDVEEDATTFFNSTTTE